MMLRLKWKFEWQYIPYNIKNGLRNLWYWRDVIWNDRNFDHTYIYKILRHKLQSQADYIEKRAFYVGFEYDVDRMRTCIKLLDRLIEGYYGMEYFDFIKIKCDFEERSDGRFEYKSEVLKDNLDEYFSRYKSVLRRENLNMEDRHYSAIKLSCVNENRAKDLLFKIINRDISKWWV